ncbi:hypothetical protein F1C16_10855 [Hymenobacter sp. NBH84]|uniref:hypothetical protein n=1 Tax=Hymenobacter sp. NBH84 TaxID=2596915 RepID=UPI001628F5F8|nr:hypothetical protein [Hymenobacter sp. NBH84]QNE40022.1 hypothetical protein F1C16_10855 [Hymenobacter sp. NBH84]
MQVYTEKQRVFLSNLEKVVFNFTASRIACEQTKFRIILIDEPGKQNTSIDDLMNNVIFRKSNFAGRNFGAEEVVKLLTAPIDKFPLWIKIRLGEDMVCELSISKRFRPFRELLHQETGHPPFCLCE